MSHKRFEWKVGLFVAFGLGLLVVLLILFSKGVSFTPTYVVRLKAESAGILKAHAAVVMAGVPVGSISQIQLAPDNRSVTILLKIQRRFEIHRDARFIIEQAGFLGDQYILISPTANATPSLQDGDEVSAEMPFDMQEVARSAAGFIKRVDDTIADVRRLALNPETLSNLAVSVSTLRKFSDEALVAAGNVNALVLTNSASVNATVANLAAATGTLTNLLADVQSGKGVAGQAIENPKLAADLAQTVANLSVVSSNLNRFGIWHALWHENPPLTNPPAAGRPRLSAHPTN